MVITEYVFEPTVVLGIIIGIITDLYKKQLDLNVPGFVLLVRQRNHAMDPFVIDIQIPH